MKTPIWIEKKAIILMHDMTLAEHGGANGIRDEGLFESAIARPQQLFSYGEPSIFELAAAYAFGLAKNHAFVDGNKRIAFLVSRVFLLRNGFTIAATQEEKYQIYYGLAAGSVSEEALSVWLQNKSTSN